MIRRSHLVALAAMVGVTVAITATGSSATTDELDSQNNFFRESLISFNENPALSTDGTAQLRLVINDKAQEINWRLSYANLSAPITQAHVHFGNTQQNGGVSFFFCTNGTAPPGVTVQACPPAPATISGTVKAGDVVGPAAQGIPAGDFAKIVRAIRAGFTYANIHTMAFPGGEIRSQLGHQH